MLEEALDPRPSQPLDFSRLLGATAIASTDPAATLAQHWNEEVSFWSNLRTLEYWIDRARG